MYKHLKTLVFTVLTLITINSCTKVEGPLTDLKPAVPVTVQNAVDFRPEPTVSTTLSSGNIQIILSIPASSGRTIKEITKVASNTTYSQIQSTGSTGFYTTAPISATGTTATFNTTIAEYMTKNAITAAPTVNTELARRFYFLLTLDDGTVIVTNPVRVLVL